ncbi:hypothetical protein [Leptospira noguchii]|uniref:Uncharacterized protein n=1 Tax=Leptospira noguchii TaxID=28182 RepID=A0AAE9GGF8_9LEPT|nr:hypothetical protein [Leptospira noguchii]UOG51829.1 hypothetical protein MAL09_14355 [Leptospira noguchii]UOG57492.1 hypothetical protein MAL03_04925 [Leptospira noguchii]
MLRFVESSIEFEKFRRNWSEKNSMKRFLRKRLKLGHNAHYHNQPHELNRILESKLNSAKRSPKGRVLGSKTHIFQVFRQE